MAAGTATTAQTASRSSDLRQSGRRARRLLDLTPPSVEGRAPHCRENAGDSAQTPRDWRRLPQTRVPGQEFGYCPLRRGDEGLGLTRVLWHQRSIRAGSCEPTLAGVAQLRNDGGVQCTRRHESFCVVRPLLGPRLMTQRSIGSPIEDGSGIAFLQEHAVHDPAGRFCSRQPRCAPTLEAGGSP